MKKVIVLLAGLFIILVTLVILRIQEANLLEASLLNCNTFPSYCEQTMPIEQADFEEFDNPQMSQTLFHYLTQEGGFQDIRWVQYQATNDPRLVNRFLQWFTFDNSLNGKQLLTCPEYVCSAEDYNAGVVMLLAEGDPVIHKWDISRKTTDLGINGLTISGIEDQKLVIFPYEPKETFEEVMSEVSNPPLPEYEILLENASNNEESLLWHKQDSYEITCSLLRCKKTYTALN